MNGREKERVKSVLVFTLPTAMHTHDDYTTRRGRKAR